MNHSAISQSLVVELDTLSQERSLRILLAENNRQLRRLLALILRRDGHVVVEATNGTELLDLMASTLVDGGQPHFDLIIAQHCIPGVLGLTILAGLRENDRALPFILIANSADVQDQARRLGALVLGNSFNVEAIRAAVLETQAPAGPERSRLSRGATRRAAR